MTLPNLKDFGYVAGALFLAVCILLTPRLEDLTRFSLWPEAFKWAAITAIVALLAYAFGYAHAWSRREDMDREA